MQRRAEFLQSADDALTFRRGQAIQHLAGMRTHARIHRTRGCLAGRRELQLHVAAIRCQRAARHPALFDQLVDRATDPAFFESEQTSEFRLRQPAALQEHDQQTRLRWRAFFVQETALLADE